MNGSNTSSTLGAVIRDCRRQLGGSQEELATRLITTCHSGDGSSLDRKAEATRR